MKRVVVYKSKTGFAKKYAEWISHELTSDIYDISEVNKDILSKYDTIIYGAGLYAIGINGLKKMKKYFELFKDKKIVVFASGATPYREKTVEQIKNSNFTQEEQKYINFFYLRGGFDYSKLKFIDKILMTLMKKKLQNKKELTPDDRGMLAAYEKPVDFAKKKNIEQLIKFI